MNTLIANLAEVSGIPVRQLASGTITASDWFVLMSTYRSLVGDLDAEGQDKLDAVLDQLEARLPLEVPLCGSLLATLAPRVIATAVFASFSAL